MKNSRLFSDGFGYFVAVAALLIGLPFVAGEIEVSPEYLAKSSACAKQAAKSWIGYNEKPVDHLDFFMHRLKCRAKAEQDVERAKIESEINAQYGALDK